MNKYEIPDLLESLDDLDLVNVIGSLYDLGEDNAPIIADHLEEMESVQDRVSELIDDTKALVQAYKDQSEELAKQKEANTKLMYERLRRAENVEKEEDKEAEALDDALDDIDIYDIDED